MLVSYKEKIIFSIIIILLDGILINYIPSYFNSINLFYPMLTISLLPFLYDNSKIEYSKLCFFIGIIYDLLYSNIFLYHALFFFLLGKLDIKIIKLLNNNLILYVVLVIINIVAYDLVFYLLVNLTNYQIININGLIYKIKNSLLLNIMSSFIYYFWFKKRKLLHKM